MEEQEIYLKFSQYIYDEIAYNAYGYTQLVIPGLTDNNGYYKNGNFVCAAYIKNNKILISFRGTDSIKLWEESSDIFSDLQIACNKIPENDFAKAEYFFNQLANSNVYGNYEYEFTGHSLGGAIAQLMGAKYGNKTVTFNAPGMLNLMNKLAA